MRAPIATALFALLVLPLAALASGLELAPVLVELDGRTHSAVIALRNGGSELSRYQVTVQSWSETAAGKMELAPTGDITFYPPLLELKPGEKRNLRVGAATPIGQLEKTYRLFVEELPPPPAPGLSQVRVLTRVGIPIFLEPPLPAATARIEALATTAGKAGFKLRNTGSIRVRPLSIKLVARDAAGAAVFEKALDGWYVLAQRERDYQVELPKDICAKVRKLEVQSAIEQTPLIASAPVAAGAACGN